MPRGTKKEKPIVHSTYDGSPKHHTHKMELIKGYLGSTYMNEACEYCLKCTCHDRDNLLDRICRANPQIVAKRKARQGITNL